MLYEVITVCQKGSVGACGDLAPMSQIALLMMGEGRAYYKGKLMPAKEAMDKAGIPVRITSYNVCYTKLLRT